jgi:hypothetical protein
MIGISRTPCEAEKKMTELAEDTATSTEAELSGGPRRGYNY